jgi:hypothetical protein
MNVLGAGHPGEHDIGGLPTGYPGARYKVTSRCPWQ